MRGLAVRGALALALCAGLAGALRAGDDEPEKPAAKSSSWLSWFGGGEKPAVKEKPDAEDEKPAGPTAAERAALKRRELDDYYRRIAVCDRLLTIAVEKGDADLEQRVNELI